MTIVIIRLGIIIIMVSLDDKIHIIGMYIYIHIYIYIHTVPLCNIVLYYSHRVTNDNYSNNHNKLYHDSAYSELLCTGNCSI